MAAATPLRFAMLLAASLTVMSGRAAAVVATQDRELIVDLSRHEVAISVDFAGADLVLFGATEGVGDVVVEVRGPLRREVVRRKERMAGIWMNRDQMIFDRVPAFYAVAGSRPLEDLMTDKVLADEQIGPENLFMVPEGPQDTAEVAAFRSALVRGKQAAGLFSRAPGSVRFLGGRLFRTDIRFPSNAAIGLYQVNVLLVKEGEVVRATRTPLILSRVGFEARVFQLAHQQALAYGLLAVAVATVAGWLASMFFRSKA